MKHVTRFHERCMIGGYRRRDVIGGYRRRYLIGGYRRRDLIGVSGALVHFLHNPTSIFWNIETRNAVNRHWNSRIHMLCRPARALLARNVYKIYTRTYKHETRDRTNPGVTKKIRQGASQPSVSFSSHHQQHQNVSLLIAVAISTDLLLQIHSLLFRLIEY